METKTKICGNHDFAAIRLAVLIIHYTYYILYQVYKIKYGEKRTTTEFILQFFSAGFVVGRVNLDSS